MKIITHKLASSQRHGFNRHGLSVIEVLTSIVVALIGVFGVLAMIPFSVKQTQSGLDQDAATSMARNAVSRFEAGGFKVAFDQVDAAGAPTGLKQLNWIRSDGLTRVNTSAAAATLLCIDPLGAAEGGITSFPPRPTTTKMPPLSVPAVLGIPTVTLAGPAVTAVGDPIPFSIAEARRMFRITDDLVFEQSDDPAADLLGPIQVFNEGAVGGAAAPINRQSNGTISWCAIAHPEIVDPKATEITSYKFYILAFKDRVTDPSVPESEMFFGRVLGPTGFGPTSTITIDSPLTIDVRHNDWVMLINQAAGSTPEAFRTNVAFARVTNAASEDPDVVPDPKAFLTLDGPDFLYTPNTSEETATYVVHLRDVIAVFPRTIKLETNSGWTVTAD